MSASPDFWTINQLLPSFQVFPKKQNQLFHSAPWVNRSYVLRNGSLTDPVDLWNAFHNKISAILKTWNGITVTHIYFKGLKNTCMFSLVKRGPRVWFFQSKMEVQHFLGKIPPVKSKYMFCRKKNTWNRSPKSVTVKYHLKKTNKRKRLNKTTWSNTWSFANCNLYRPLNMVGPFMRLAFLFHWGTLDGMTLQISPLKLDSQSLPKWLV